MSLGAVCSTTTSQTGDTELHPGFVQSRPVFAAFSVRLEQHFASFARCEETTNQNFLFCFLLESKNDCFQLCPGLDLFNTGVLRLQYLIITINNFALCRKDICYSHPIWLDDRP